jgi:hypothetical protein
LAAWLATRPGAILDDILSLFKVEFYILASDVMNFSLFKNFCIAQSVDKKYETKTSHNILFLILDDPNFLDFSKLDKMHSQIIFSDIMGQTNNKNFAFLFIEDFLVRGLPIPGLLDLDLPSGALLTCPPHSSWYFSSSTRLASSGDVNVTKQNPRNFSAVSLKSYACSCL